MATESHLNRIPLRGFLIFSCGLLFAAMVALIVTKPISQDEGVFLTIGKYLNNGLVPYRDFFDHKPPGIYFLFAGLFKIFGTSVWAIKVGLTLSILGTARLLKKISDELRPGSGWLATALFLFLMTQFEGYYLIAEPFMLLPLLLAWWFVLKHKNRAGPMFAAGALLAIAVAFKQTAALSALPVLIFTLVQTKKRLIVILGLLTPLLLVVLYVQAHGVLAEAWSQIVTVNFTNYPPEPIGTILRAWRWNFGWTLPIWILLIFGSRVQLPNRKLIWLMIVLPLPFMFVRHYAHYWIQILPFAALIGAVALMTVRSVKAQIMVLVFCLAVTGGKLWQDAAENYTTLRTQFRIAEVLQADASLRWHDNNNTLLAENRFTAFYFLLNQRPLNRFLYITEVTEPLDAQQKTIDDLRRTPGTRILWPNPSYTYAEDLQQYIYGNAAVSKTFPELGMRMYISQ